MASAVAADNDESKCFKCNVDLAGKRYVIKDEHSVCTACFEMHYANMCDACAKPICINNRDLSYRDKHWHELCFVCSKCKETLVEKPFSSHDNELYCAACSEKCFSQRCEECDQPFKTGVKKLDYGNKQWHEHCFKCSLCKKVIGTQNFVAKQDSIYCNECFDDKFKTKCAKCTHVIESGGVTYKQQPYHSECFTCTNCQKALSGQKFTTKESGVYCSPCYAELFAKRCTGCAKPITGGVKLVSFENRCWHNDCFSCGQCGLSLVGKGFVGDGEEVLCADCAKARTIAQVM